MADAMGATLVMHYEISAKYFEIEDTRVLMCESLVAVGLADNALQAHTRLCKWGGTRQGSTSPVTALSPVVCTCRMTSINPTCTP